MHILKAMLKKQDIKHDNLGANIMDRLLK